MTPGRTRGSSGTGHRPGDTGDRWAVAAAADSNRAVEELLAAALLGATAAV